MKESGLDKSENQMTGMSNFQWYTYPISLRFKTVNIFLW